MTGQTLPVVEATAAPFSTVRGTLYRAVDPEYREFALSGSRAAGRYSPPETPTMYLSSSREGVAAAMIAHTGDRARALEVLAFEVVASNVVDLRDQDRLAAFGITAEDAAAPWQEDVAAGRTPSSWLVRNALLELGAHGLIDPSRKRPGLWHLTLFAWNRDGTPSVRAQTEKRKLR